MGDALLIPALQQASRDVALKGTAHTVYLWLVCNLLDVEEYRALKLSGLAHAVQIDQETASKTVRLLVKRGYLIRRYVARRGFEYRLLLSRKDVAA